MPLTERQDLTAALTTKDLFKWLQFVDLGWRDSGLLRADSFLDHLMREVKATEFEELSIPLRVVAADFWKRKQVIFQSGDIRIAVHASMAVPGIFNLVVVDKQVLVDGGVANPVPYDLVSDECDITIAIDVMGNRTESEGLVPSLSESIFNSFQIIQKSILTQKIAARPPDIYIAPEIVDIKMLEFYKADEIFWQVQSARDQLRTELEKALK